MRATNNNNNNNNNTKQKNCSLTGPTSAQLISNDPVITGRCAHEHSNHTQGHLGKRMGTCHPPIKATWPVSGTRGIPLTGNTNMPGFMLTRANRASHAVRFNKGTFRFYNQGINAFGRATGAPTGSGSNIPSNF